MLRHSACHHLPCRTSNTPDTFHFRLLTEIVYSDSTFLSRSLFTGKASLASCALSGIGLRKTDNIARLPPDVNNLSGTARPPATTWSRQRATLVHLAVVPPSFTAKPVHCGLADHHSQHLPSAACQNCHEQLVVGTINRHFCLCPGTSKVLGQWPGAAAL